MSVEVLSVSESKAREREKKRKRENERKREKKRETERKKERRGSADHRERATAQSAYSPSNISVPVCMYILPGTAKPGTGSTGNENNDILNILERIFK